MSVFKQTLALLLVFAAVPALAEYSSGTTDVAANPNFRNFNDVQSAFCTGSPPPIGTPENECFALSRDDALELRISWPGVNPPFDKDGLTGSVTKTTMIPFAEVLPTRSGKMDIVSLGMVIDDASGFKESSSFGAVELQVLDAATHNWRYVATWVKKVSEKFNVYFNETSPFTPLVKGILGYRLYGTQGTKRFSNPIAALTLR